MAQAKTPRPAQDAPEQGRAVNSHPPEVHPTEVQTLRVEKARLRLSLCQLQHGVEQDETERARRELDALRVEFRSREEALTLRLEAFAGRLEKATKLGQQAAMAVEREVQRTLEEHEVGAEFRAAYRVEFDSGGKLIKIADPTLEG